MIDRIRSSIRLDGVHIKTPTGKELVAKVEGDEVEPTPKDSFVEGALKGVGVALLGSYAGLAGAYKAAEGGYKAYQLAKRVGADDWTATKAGIKGALIGGVKGFLHGAVDSMFIGLGIAASVAAFGPLGLAAAPLIGGAYNVVKDAIRS